MEQNSYGTYFNSPPKRTKQKPEANCKEHRRNSFYGDENVCIVWTQNFKETWLLFPSSPLVLLFSSEDELRKRQIHYDQGPSLSQESTTELRTYLYFSKEASAKAVVTKHACEKEPTYSINWSSVLFCPPKQQN